MTSKKGKKWLMALALATSGLTSVTCTAEPAHRQVPIPVGISIAGKARFVIGGIVLCMINPLEDTIVWREEENEAHHSSH